MKFTERVPCTRLELRFDARCGVNDHGAGRVDFVLDGDRLRGPVYFRLSLRRLEIRDSPAAT